MKYTIKWNKKRSFNRGWTSEGHVQSFMAIQNPQTS